MSEEEHTEDEASTEAAKEEMTKEKDQIKDEKAEAKKEEVTKKKEIKDAPTPSKTREDNVIYIGNKPPMNYVLALITAFNVQNTEEIVLKARGRAITTAVDVAEIARNRFIKDAEVRSIAIGTEEVASREGGNPRNVSIIEISLHK